MTVMTGGVGGGGGGSDYTGFILLEVVRRGNS